MQLRDDGDRRVWLAYGMNVHPGGDAAAWHAALASTVEPLRRRLGHRGPFGLAVRLDAAGVRHLLDDETARERLVAAHGAAGLVPFTGNAFVAGRFHGAGVKEQVYAPPWEDRARPEYTVQFARLLAAFHAPGARLSLSTAPGSWKAWGGGAPAETTRAQALVATARALADLEGRTGVTVRLGLEPEPGCTLETVEETLAFFQGPLARALVGHEACARFLGVCFDVCHQAVRHEDVGGGLERLLDAGIPIVKVQLSVALEVPDPGDEEARAALARFEEGTYLHQVVAPDGAGGLAFAPDLGVALADPAWRRRAPWRVHFHVPVDRRRMVGGLATTAAALDAALDVVARRPEIEHLEIETYTFDVLPAEERREGPDGPLVEGLLAEQRHVLQALAARGLRPTEDPS